MSWLFFNEVSVLFFFILKATSDLAWEINNTVVREHPPGENYYHDNHKMTMIIFIQ